MTKVELEKKFEKLKAKAGKKRGKPSPYTPEDQAKHVFAIQELERPARVEYADQVKIGLGTLEGWASAAKIKLAKGKRGPKPGNKVKKKATAKAKRGRPAKVSTGPVGGVTYRIDPELEMRASAADDMAWSIGKSHAGGKTANVHELAVKLGKIKAQIALGKETVEEKDAFYLLGANFIAAKLRDPSPSDSRQILIALGYAHVEADKAAEAKRKAEKAA